MSYDVVVVGSGAGGGVVAGELAERGRSVLLLEAGPHLTAHDFMRWEAHANHTLYWPLRMAFPPEQPPVVFLAGRCVGGTTTINTKIAWRATDADVAKWGMGLTGADLAPYYERVERRLGVRERTDWQKSVRTVERGFAELGHELHPARSYADANCTSCGSCLQGCSTNAGKSTENTYIADALLSGRLELRAGTPVDHVVVEGGSAVGVEAGGETIRADAVVVAGGALNTPQLLRRSGLTNPMIGRNLGLHPVRLVYGLFDEPQDAHLVYPITAHCTDFQTDEAGGFVIEATTIQDPIAFATTIGDENGPMWGDRLVEAVRKFRHWVGVIPMVTDENTSAVTGEEEFHVDFSEVEQARIDAGLEFSRRVLEAAGARQIAWSGIASTHVQGSCRMGDDPETSVVDRNGQTHEVKGLYVGDGSLIPKTLSVNPSLTIMALATRLAEHLAA